jgi:hypothetical protein
MHYTQREGERESIMGMAFQSDERTLYRMRKELLVSPEAMPEVLLKSALMRNIPYGKNLIINRMKKAGL